MQVCPACGEENPERARFCLACGQSLAVEAPAVEERKVVSVLFVDLVGFTDRSDRADPEDVRATLRPYHERVKADIERFGGTVEKFIGDAVMAVFGAPVAHEDDAERAVRSGLRVLDTIEELREDGLELAVRAAVTTGEAVVALGARPERGEGIVTGDVVNTAARLQSAAPVGSVLVDETTMRTVGAAISCEQLDSVEAKGKAEPIPVWRVLGARSRVGQPEAATRTPYVGREHERRLLLETFLRAERESSVQLVTVVGEPGIGKSRLVTELRTALDERPDLVTWRHGRCLPYGEGITFWALGEIVKAECGILESDDADDAAAKLERTVSALIEDDADRAWVISRLAPLIGAGEGSTASREEAFAAWRRFLEELAAQRPCVLVVEDLHWADGPLLEFIEYLLDWSAPVPLLLLCTARPELFERQSSWGGGKRNATTISLSPLSTEEAARLLQLVLDRTLLPAETQSLLLERAGGNPLYAEQFARMLAEREGAGELAVPETVQALMAARLDTLRPELKALLHDSAVVGRIFWSGAVAALAGRPRDEVRRDLNELVHREFVRPVRVSSIEGEDELAFWHGLVRDVAYGQIPRAPRAAKHLAAARWVEERAGERVADHAEILVHHLGQADELARAAGAERPEITRELVRVLLLAGERASNLDTAAAEVYFRRAVALAGDDELAHANAQAGLARVLFHRGEFAEAAELYERSIETLSVLDEGAAGRAMLQFSSLAWGRGDVRRSERLGLDAIALLERRSPGADLVQAYGSAALRYSIANRFDDALPLIENGFAVALESGVEDVTVLLNAKASVAGYRGDPAAVDVLQEAIDLGLRLGLARSTAISMNNRGDGLRYFVGAREGLAQLSEAVEFSRSRGLKDPEMWQRGERLQPLYHLGEWEELRSEAEEILAWEQESGGGQLGVIVRAYLAYVLVHCGAADDAGAHVEALMPKARESGDPQVLVPGLSAAALVAAARGDDTRALEHVREVERLTHDKSSWRDYCLTWPARIALAAGDVDLARAFLDDEEYDAAWNRAARRGARALFAEVEGRGDEAAVLYGEAAERWETYGSVVERGYALLGLGRCGDAKARLDAQAIFTRLGASPVLAQAA